LIASDDNVANVCWGLVYVSIVLDQFGGESERVRGEVLMTLCFKEEL
jgi:hypothetical protein